jgi:TP901 family phage tail tape measure protein
MAYDGTLKFDTKVDTSGFSSGISKIAGIAKTGLGAAVTAIGAVSTALSTAGGFAVKTGMDFEAQMSRVKAISGATGSEFESLKQQAIDLGAATSFSATESAEAMENLASAGFSVSEIMDAMPGMLDLAASSGEDLASSADIASSTLRAFGLEASEAGHVADVLAKNAANTNAAVMDTGYAMKYVAPVAHSAGWSLEEVTAAIGKMADAGIKGEQAGTTLRGALTRMMNPTDAMADAMEELGVTFYDSEGKMKSLSTIIDELQTATAGLTEEQRDNKIATIFGTEALSGMKVLLSSSKEELDSLTEGLKNSDGAAKEMAETMQDNLKGATEEFMGSLETLGISIYEQMQEPLKNAVSQGTEYINQLTETFRSGGLKEAVAEAGNIFAELAVKAAEKAPEMINAAVEFIRSFINGIKNHAPELLQAAQEIVWALVDGLVKLLPSEIQKPVKETVNILKKSFQDGGLKNAINTVSNILKNLGKVVTNLAKTLLPPLAKAVDFVADNLKILLPLATSVVAAWKTWSIVQQIKNWMTAASTAIAAAAAATTTEAAATTASTTALTLKQVAVGVLTGQISLATAAQWLWNAAMNANPIGIIITAVAALAGGIAALCMSMDDGKTAEEEQAAANQALAKSFDDVAEGVANFQSGLDTAKSHLSEFDDTLFASSEEQQKLSDNMQEVQDGITTICKTASAERRGYTDQEIQQLDTYFQRLNELNQQQLDIERDKADAIKSQAEYIAETHSGSLVEYQQKSLEWIKTAQDQADQQIQIINDQTTSELVLLQQAFEDRHEMSQDEYDSRRKEIIEEGQRDIAEAQSIVGEVSNAYLNGYLERADDLREWLTTKQELAQQEQEEIQTNNEKVQELENAKKQELEKIYNDTNLSIGQKQGAAHETTKYYNDLIDDENQRHADEMERIKQGLTQGMTKEQEDQLSIWIAMLGDTELYGGNISTENQEMVDTILAYYGRLEGDAKESFKSMMDGAMEGIEEKEPSLFEKAGSMIGGVINKINNALGIASPSKVMRKIFRYVVEGAEVGMGDEAPSLYKQTDGIAGGVISRFQKAKLDASALVTKMRAAIASEQARISSPMAVTAQYKALRDSSMYSGTDPENQDGNYVAEIHVDLDGREVARATAPFMGSQLAWEG